MNVATDELWFLELPHERIVMLLAVLAGHEGLAVPRVLEKKRGLVELLVAPDLSDDLRRVLDDLSEFFPLRRIERPEGVRSILDDVAVGDEIAAEESDAAD